VNWEIPRLWDGQTVAVLASGPSMSQESADRMRDRPVIAVNNTFRLAPWADMLYAADASWWAHTNRRGFDGYEVSCSVVPGILKLRNAGRTGYSDDVDCVHTYGNSGAQAIQIAAKAGAARILLYGFDMKPGHWHGAHSFPLRETSPQSYRTWADEMHELADAMSARSIEVLNCTPGSALTCFPFETAGAIA
jgi:hypothetical protein